MSLRGLYSSVFLPWTVTMETPSEVTKSCQQLYPMLLHLVRLFLYIPISHYEFDINWYTVCQLPAG